MQNPTTYDEQIDILIERGIIVKDRNFAKQVLSNLSYYTFTTYIYQYKDLEGNYEKNITFEQIYRIYLFDMKFRNILLYTLEIIEASLKTKIAYYSAHKLGPLGYLDERNFKDSKEFRILTDKLNNLLKKNRKVDFIDYYSRKYDGDLPIWVSINMFSMGMLYNYYKNLSEYNKISGEKTVKKSVASEYNTGANQLCSWIENISYIRNMLAHYMRVYNVKLKKTPAKCKKNHGKSCNVTNRIFDTVYIMKFLVLNKEQWNNNILIKIICLFEEYKDVIDISLLGFPENWEKVLKK